MTKAVVALANAEGGRIYIGVKNSGEIVGSKRLQEEYWKNESAIEGMILSSTTPSHGTKVSVLAHDEHKIICIHVPKAQTTIGTSSGLYLKRRINSKGQPENQPMTPDEIFGGITRLGTNDFSATVLNGLSFQDIDLQLADTVFEQLRKEAQDPKSKEIYSQGPDNILKTLGLLSHDEKPNIACLLLFGKDQSLRDRLPNYYVQYQVFGEGGELLKNERYSEPIAKLFPKLLEFPEMNRNSDEFRLRGQTHKIPEYPEDSRREALANALVHRDYSLPSGVQIQVYEGEITVISPGSFPPGVTLNNLLSTPPTPRNRRLTEAMSLLKFVESSGRGIDFIFKGQAYYGRPAPDYTDSNSSRVSVRLVGGKANLDFCRFIISSIDDPSVYDLLILNSLFFHRDHTIEEIQALIQKPKAFAEQRMVSLHKKGLIEISSDRTARYFLKGSVHPAARNAVKPQRMSKVEISEFRNQIVAELKRRNPLSKTEIADLIGLSEPQAYRLLAKLEKDGRVVTKNKQWYLS